MDPVTVLWCCFGNLCHGCRQFWMMWLECTEQSICNKGVITYFHIEPTYVTYVCTSDKNCKSEDILTCRTNKGIVSFSQQQPFVVALHMLVSGFLFLGCKVIFWSKAWYQQMFFLARLSRDIFACSLLFFKEHSLAYWFSLLLIFVSACNEKTQIFCHDRRYFSKKCQNTLILIYWHSI